MVALFVMVILHGSLKHAPARVTDDSKYAVAGEIESMDNPLHNWMGYSSDCPSPDMQVTLMSAEAGDASPTNSGIVATNFVGITDATETELLKLALTDTVIVQGGKKFTPRNVMPPPPKGATGNVSRKEGFPKTSRKFTRLLARIVLGLLNSTCTVQNPALIEVLKTATTTVELMMLHADPAVPHTFTVQF